MLTGKYISSASVVEKLFGIPYGFPPQYVNESDVYELIYTAMSLIGDPSAMLNKVALIQISNYRGDLPCDLFSIDKGGVRMYPSGIVFDLNTDIYFQDTSYNSVIDEQLPDENEMQFTLDSVTTYIKKFDQSIETLKAGEATGGDYVYNVDNNYIVTPIQSCTLEMSYIAFPTESDGKGGFRPMVPDNERYIKGVVAYCAENIALYLFNKDLLSEKKYQILSKESCWYMGSAQNVGRIPSLDGAEVIKNGRQSLIPDPFHHRNGFRNLGKPNLIKTHNGRRR